VATAAIATETAQESRARTVRGRIPELDGVRGIALLLVVAFHFSLIFDELPGWGHALRSALVAGWCGVDLFFVLSGFLITGILLDSRDAPGYFKRFYARRALRILPVYYAALLLALTVGRSVLAPNGVSAGVTLGYVFHVSNWLSLGAAEIDRINHFWSLAVEEQFYLFWPMAVFFLSRRALMRLCVAVIAIAPAVRAAILMWGEGSAVASRMAFVLTPARADVIAYGALVALAVREPHAAEWLRRYAGGAFAIFAGVIVACFVFRTRIGLNAPLQRSLLYSIIGIAFAFGVATAVLRGVSLLRSAPLQTAGRYSYCAYVVHFPLFWIFLRVARLCAHSLPLALAFFIGLTALTMAIAAGSWRFFESRILALKSRF